MYLSRTGLVHSICNVQATVKYILFLLSEISTWFHHSELRREAYKELFRVMNTATEFKPNRTAPLLYEKPSFTWCLVRGKVMFNNLMN
jgi:hypothetical protein